MSDLNRFRNMLVCEHIDRRGATEDGAGIYVKLSCDPSQTGRPSLLRFDAEVAQGLWCGERHDELHADPPP